MSSVHFSLEHQVIRMFACAGIPLCSLGVMPGLYFLIQKFSFIFFSVHSYHCSRCMLFVSDLAIALLQGKSVQQSDPRENEPPPKIIS